MDTLCGHYSTDRGQLRSFKSPGQGERNTVWKTSSAGPQGVSVEEGLDQSGHTGGVIERKKICENSVVEDEDIGSTVDDSQV